MVEIRHSVYGFAGLASAVILSSALPALAQDIPDDFLLKLERTSCLGECPVYSVSVDAYGSVTYEGTSQVRVKGRQTARIPVTQVVALVQTIDRIRFEDLRDQYRVGKTLDGSEYPASDSDAPTSYVTLTRNGRTKKVEDHLGAPDGLKDLEHQIDQAARTKRWIRIEGQTVLDLARSGWMPASDEGAELLRRALMYDDVDAVSALLEIGVDPNTMYYGTHSAAIMFAESAAATRALLAAGADPSVVNDNGATALGHAVSLVPEVTEALLKAGARADQPDGRFGIGRTALSGAACNGNIGVVKLLLAARVPPDLTDALQCARNRRVTFVPADPRFSKLPYVQDYDSVIALLEQVVAKRRR